MLQSMKNLSLLALFTLCSMFSLGAQEDRRLNYHLGGYVQSPIEMENDFSFGFFGEVRIHDHLGIMLDLEFKKGFYSYDNGTWLGPMNWNQVNSNGSNRSDWIFYQWDCISSLYLNFHFPIPNSELSLSVGAAPSLHFVMDAPSVDNYPEFEAYYEGHRQEVINTMGLQFRVAAELEVFRYVNLGTGAKLKINQLKTFEEEWEAVGAYDYLGSNVELFFYLSIGI